MKPPEVCWNCKNYCRTFWTRALKVICKKNGVPAYLAVQVKCSLTGTWWGSAWTWFATRTSTVDLIDGKESKRHQRKISTQFRKGYYPAMLTLSNWLRWLHRCHVPYRWKSAEVKAGVLHPDACCARALWQRTLERPDDNAAHAMQLGTPLKPWIAIRRIGTLNAKEAVVAAPLFDLCCKMRRCCQVPMIFPHISLGTRINAANGFHTDFAESAGDNPRSLRPTRCTHHRLPDWVVNEFNVPIIRCLSANCVICGEY